MRRSVDFPIPGSPETSTSEAGTRPPPSTRSSSATPVGEPLRVGCLDLDELEGAAGGRRGLRDHLLGGDALLGERAPAPAVGATPEPAARSSIRIPSRRA